MIEDYASMYQALHRKKAKHFTGISIYDGLPFIIPLVERIKPRKLLDYGCGKGLQYTRDEVHLKWGGLMPRLYDPGVKELSKAPKGSYDGVICTDVMEHINIRDVEEVLNHIFSLVPVRDDGGESFAFFWISCRPAMRKKLPDGRNVHLTVKPGEWWADRLKEFERDRLIIEAHYETDDVA